MRLEKHIEAALCKELLKLGAMFVKLNLLGQRSWPDRFVIADNGAMMLIELKKPGKDLSPLQAALHQQLRLRKVPVTTVRSVEEGLKFYAEQRARWQDYLDWMAQLSSCGRTKKKA